jgi:uncharacterized protein YndB with AHSA1/START domain
MPRIERSVEIDRPPSEVWAIVADYASDTRWRVGVVEMRASAPGPVEPGVTTHEALRFLGATFLTDATIDQVEPGRRFRWRSADRQKHLEGSRQVEPTARGGTRVTSAVDVELLGPWRLLQPLVVWSFRRRTGTDLERLKHTLESSTRR